MLTNNRSSHFQILACPYLLLHQVKLEPEKSVAPHFKYNKWVKYGLKNGDVCENERERPWDFEMRRFGQK